MIISHLNEFVFLKSSKVAGTTVESILSLNCGPEDIITPFCKHQLAIPELQNVTLASHRVPFEWAPGLVIGGLITGQGRLHFRKHDSAKRVSKLMPDHLWNRYTKVVVMRNPFDRIISWYFWDRKEGAKSGRTFKDYVLRNRDKITSFRDQTEVNGLEIAVVYLRFENLDEDIRALYRRLGISHLNETLLGSLRIKSGHRPAYAKPANMFADFPDGVELINKLCAKEISAFNYSI